MLNSDNGGDIKILDGKVKYAVQKRVVLADLEVPIAGEGLQVRGDGSAEADSMVPRLVRCLCFSGIKCQHQILKKRKH